MTVFCLISSIWSGSVVFAKLVWRKDIHALNLAWFAVCAAGFVYYMGWIK